MCKLERQPPTSPGGAITFFFLKLKSLTASVIKKNSALLMSWNPTLRYSVCHEIH